MIRSAAACAAIAIAAAVSPAWAVDGVALEAGAGEGVRMGRIGLVWDWNRRWFQGNQWHLGGYWDLSLGYWNSRTVQPGQNDDITEIAITPVFRIQRNNLQGPYVEAGIGAHLLSRSEIGNKQLSTNFQFGDHIGIGYRFGQFDLGYRFQHLSNAGIKRPNPGINFSQIRVTYNF
jgi:lipid A 3-O-deacylase